MKQIFFIAIILFISAGIYSQTVLTSKEAKDHIGETVSVMGKVADVYTSKNGRTLINFDDKYPNQTFTVVIPEDSKIDISNIKAGVTLTVSGLIESYKDKPEIIVKSQDQIIKVE
jgi:DNA/RNA endonuclease YhcR with UshA esterase domain